MSKHMPRQVVRREFDVDLPLDRAWSDLAQVEDWPSWARHIRRVTVEPPGELGPSSAGALRLRGGIRSTFRMATWDPPRRWEWIGPLLWLRVHYDHQFTSLGPEGTRMTWIVSLSGRGAALIRPIFAAIYGRDIDRAIPRLQAAMRAAEGR